MQRIHHWGMYIISNVYQMKLRLSKWPQTVRSSGANSVGWYSRK